LYPFARWTPLIVRMVLSPFGSKSTNWMRTPELLRRTTMRVLPLLTRASLLAKLVLPSLLLLKWTLKLGPVASVIFVHLSVACSRVFEPALSLLEHSVRL